MRIKAPREAFQAHIESNDFGIWAGNGRVVAESTASTIIYLDERFQLPLVKIGNGNVLRKIYQDDNMQASIAGPDLARFAGENYRFDLRARTDPTHLMDIRGVIDRYTVVETSNFPVFATHCRSAAELVTDQSKQWIYAGGRLRKRIASINEMGSALYIGLLPVELPAMAIPKVNALTFDMVFHSVTSFLASKQDIVLISKEQKIFLQASLAEAAIPLKLSELVADIVRVQDPLLVISDTAALIRAVELQQCAGASTVFFSVADDALCLQSDQGTVSVSCQQTADITRMAFDVRLLSLLEKVLDVAQETKVALAPVKNPSLIFIQPDRYLVLATVRTSS